MSIFCDRERHLLKYDELWCYWYYRERERFVSRKFGYLSAAWAVFRCKDVKKVVDGLQLACDHGQQASHGRDLQYFSFSSSLKGQYDPSANCNPRSLVYRPSKFLLWQTLPRDQATDESTLSAVHCNTRRSYSEFQVLVLLVLCYLKLFFSCLTFPDPDVVGTFSTTWTHLTSQATTEVKW